MDPLEYLHLQMRLEGKGLSRDGLIASLGPDSEDIPLVLLAEAVDGRHATYLGESLPGSLREEARNWAENHPFSEIEILLGQIRSCGISIKASHYRTFIFPVNFSIEKPSEVKCLPKGDKRVKDFGLGVFADSVYAVISGDVIISACVSTRQNKECAESWVFTSPEYRRMGFARKVVMAWAMENRESNIIPFYSHKIDNLPSANLAASLGLIPMFEEISIEREC